MKLYEWQNHLSIDKIILQPNRIKPTPDNLLIQSKKDCLIKFFNREASQAFKRSVKRTVHKVEIKNIIVSAGVK